MDSTRPPHSLRDHGPLAAQSRDSAFNVYVRSFHHLLEDAGRELHRVEWEALLAHVDQRVEYLRTRGRRAA